MLSRQLSAWATWEWAFILTSLFVIEANFLKLLLKMTVYWYLTTKQVHYRYFSNVSVLFRNTAFQKMLNVMQHTQRNETQSVWEWERENNTQHTRMLPTLISKSAC